MNFQKKELKDFIIAVFVIALVFAFNDGSDVFEWNYWLTNYFNFIFISAIALFINVSAKKIYSNSIGAISTFKLWGMRRINLYKGGKTKGDIYIGIILAMIITLFSAGELFFPIVGITFATVALKSDRAQRKFRQLTDLEFARIHAIGPIASIILALLLSPLKEILFFSSIIKVSYIIGILSLIPLPQLDGFTLLLSSRMLYFFTIVFSVLAWLFAYITNAFSSLTLAFFMATAFALFMYYKGKAH
jgi:hypothetical protein